MSKPQRAGLPVADTLTRESGKVTLDGWSNQDVASYLTDPAGITASLRTKRVTRARIE